MRDGGREPLYIPDTSVHPVTKHLDITCKGEIGSYIGVPIILHNKEFFGTLCVLSKEKHKLKEKDISKLKTFASLIASSLDVDKAYQEIYKRERQRLHDLALGKDIQRNVLSKPIKKENITISAIYEASDIVSGDMYSWYEIRPNVYGVFLVDVMGHGLSSALITMSVRSLSYNLMHEVEDPVNVLKELNKSVFSLFKDHQESVNMYVTAVYMIIDMNLESIEYVNAGHPYPIIMSNGELYQSLRNGTTPLGILEDFTVESDTIPINQDIEILLFTDGVLEILPNKRKGMVEIITESCHAAKGKNVSYEEYMIQRLEEYQKLPDDVSLITVSITAPCLKQG